MSQRPTRPLRWPELAAEIARQDLRIVDVAAAVGFTNSQSLNQAMRGAAEIGPARKAAIAEFLGRPVDVLFAETSTPETRAVTSAAEQGYDAMITDEAVLRRLAALVAAQLATT